VVALLAMEEVQAELKLTDEQKAKLREVRSELGGGPGAGGNRGNFRDMSREERQKQMEELRKQMEERAKKAEELVKGVLTPEQSTRLGELRIQREGIQAFTRSEVVAALMLTDAQKEAVLEILESARPQRGQGGGQGRNADPEAFRKVMEELQEKRKKAQADIEAILTDTQKAEWTKLHGAMFDFPERPAGGRGGRGAPGGGNRAARRPAEA
jgi:Spy/CpxP family protein refolding chaperone